MSNKSEQPSAEELAEARNKGEEGRVENESVVSDPIADFTEAMRGIMDREEEAAATVKAAGEAAPEEIAQRTGAKLVPEEISELAAVGQKAEDLARETETMLGNVQAAVKGEFEIKKGVAPEITNEPKVVAEGAEEVIELTEKDRKKPKPSSDVIPAQAGIQKPVKGEFEMKEPAPPEERSFTKMEEKWFKEGEPEVVVGAEEAPKPSEASPAISPPSEGGARGGKTPEAAPPDARALELKILDLEEEKERIESMDLTEMVGKVSNLTPAEKKAYKKMLKTGKLTEPPKGAPESEAAGAELNRIFQRIPQVNKELADLRRQLKRTQLGGEENLPLMTSVPSGRGMERRGGVEEPEVPSTEVPANLPIVEEEAPAAPPSPELGNFKVGDRVKHPFRDEIVTIGYIGSEIYDFIPHAYAKQSRRIGSYEAIEGSSQYKELEQDGRFVKKWKRSQPSAEIDMSDDIEHRTLVVPLTALKKAE